MLNEVPDPPWEGAILGHVSIEKHCKAQNLSSAKTADLIEIMGC